MAISRMQEPQQIQSGIGSLQDPRQGYFLGKLVKKAGRAVKKITKSPLGKLALLGGGAYLTGGLMGGGGGLGNFSKLFGAMKGGLGTGGKFSTLGDLFRVGGKAKADFSIPRMLAGGLGATAIAAPFFMGGGDDEEEPVDQMDPRYQVQRAKNYYSGAGDAGAGLDFMPQKKYVMQNFYAADGGRAGYANGMLVDEDDEEEYIRSGAGMSRRQQKTFLNMGGGAGEAQAEQMLMMEYVKYKNKGGNLSFEQFVKAVMQAQQQPEGAGMEQPEAVAMAANGGRIGYAGGQLVSPSGDGSRPGYAGPLDFFKNLKSGFDQIVSGETSAFLGGDQEKINEFLTQKGYGIDLEPEIIEMIINMNKEGVDTSTISSITGADEGSVSNVINMLNMNIEQKADGGMAGMSVPGYGTPVGTNKFGYPSGGVRVNAAEGGIMATDEASEMIDMGGMEKDYRNEGGFVAMGGKERADDVPARLSKNEFVFTADAVRNAGGGDIDKGAEVMENLMSNLEQGGEISEESQGLEGAQAMYDQQQMLQSRMI